MQKWILPTLSEVLTLNELTLVDCASSSNPGEDRRSLLELREKAEWMAASQNCSEDLMPVRSKNQIVKEKLKSEREWMVAVRAVEHLLLQTTNLDTHASTIDSHLPNCQGLVLAGPAPVLSHTALLSSLPSWIFTLESLQPRVRTFQLPPATLTSQPPNQDDTTEFLTNAGLLIPLLKDDPLSSERFCVILTTKFSLVMALGEDTNGLPAFMFSFEPEVVEQAWKTLRARVLITNPKVPITQLDALIEQYPPVAPSYQTVMQFSRLLLKNFPDQERAAEQGSQPPRAGLPLLLETGMNSCDEENVNFNSPLPLGSSAPLPPSRPDVELLQAFAHEVRTPLTTIRTLTRLLLKRRDLASDVIKRLKVIDHECTEQIDRMELLFRAAELETAKVKNKGTHLTAMSLAQVLQHSIPRWQQSASRRNLTLDVVLPQQLPTVVSDPKMLDQVLTGLIENFTRSLPAGSHIQVQVIPAGDQLKLQLLHKTQSEKGGMTEHFSVPPISKALGQLLIFQPETGNISLNLTATKQLFQSIGGKLIVRQRPYQGEVLTIFLPLEEGAHEHEQGAGKRDWLLEKG